MCFGGMIALNTKKLTYKIGQLTRLGYLEVSRMRT